MGGSYHAVPATIQVSDSRQAGNGWHDHCVRTSTTSVLCSLTNGLIMSQENPLSSMQILEKMFNVEMAFMASKEKDSAILAEAFHPDVVVYEPSSVPYAGDWRGLAGVAELMHLMSDTFATFEVENLTCSGPPANMHVSCTLRIVSRKTGISVTQPFAQLLRFQEGLLIEATPFYFDTDEIRAALGILPAAEGHPATAP